MNIMEPMTVYELNFICKVKIDMYKVDLCIMNQQNIDITQ